MLIKEPGQRGTTGDMYIQRENVITIPDKIDKNTTLGAVKDVMNEIFSMTFLSIIGKFICFLKDMTTYFP